MDEHMTIPGVCSMASKGCADHVCNHQIVRAIAVIISHEQREMGTSSSYTYLAHCALHSYKLGLREGKKKGESQLEDRPATAFQMPPMLVCTFFGIPGDGYCRFLMLV